MTCITLIWTLNTGRSRGLVRLQGLRLGNGGRLPGEIPGFIFFYPSGGALPFDCT